jgi:hypothetical protein
MAEQRRELAIAEQWRQHCARFFALRDISLGHPIDWHRDYASNRTGPRVYSGRIDHRDATAIGDVKYIWELNRLQHLVSLALAFVWTGKTAYWDAIAQQTLSWIAQNPFMVGLNWKSPLEAGLRLISWALVAWLTAGDRATRDFFQRHVRETIYLHQYFLRTFYSKHSSANNHLIGEMTGLYVASICWPWYQDSIAWQAFARHKLLQAMTLQVETDGVGKELATEYQLFILEFFLLAGALGHAVGEPFPPTYWEQWRRMVGFLAAIADREQNLPMFGDGDSGQVVLRPESTCERVRTLLQITQHAPASASGPASADSRASLLLWGQSPQDLPLSVMPEPVPSTRTYPQGGYHVIASQRGSTDEMIVVFDAGRLGLAPLYAHGHADALSFWLSYGGREFLIDPGTFSYYTHQVWREYFRSTAAHNTVRVDGANQSIASGRFLWSSAAHCQLERLEEHEAYSEIAAYHEGYQRLGDPVRHQRTIRLWKPSRRLVITDRLECCGAHEVEIFFHFSELCQVWQVGATSFEAASGTKRLGLELAAPLQAALLRGSESPIAGWVSRTFGVKAPTFTLRARASVVGTTVFRTEIFSIES